MKEKIYTIPVMDAFLTEDECPFCYVERKLEEHALDFTLGPGASYMESDVREATDAAGFCRTHYKKMYDYGNRLGTGLILKTHFKKLNQELNDEIKKFSPSHTSVFGKLKKKSGDGRTSIGEWSHSKEESCYICNFYKDSFARYMDTFFEMYKADPELRKKFADSKGLCMPHFGDLTDAADRILSDKDKKEFFDVLFPLQQKNMQRLFEDLDWFCDKFDYRNKDADWKNSKDAVPRGMQKAGGGYPDMEPYTSDR